MDSDPIGEILHRLALILVGAAVMEMVDEGLPGFGRRFPRTLRFARIVGGTLLVVAGLFEAVLATVALVDLMVGGEGVATLVLLVPLAFGVGITAWGLGMVRRGWAGDRWPEPDPNVLPRTADERPDH